MTTHCTSGACSYSRRSDRRDATELVFGTEEESEDSSDPMPKGSRPGYYLLDAAREGYVYRAAAGRSGDGVRRRERGLYLTASALTTSTPPRWEEIAEDLSPDAGTEQVPHQIGAEGRGQSAAISGAGRVISFT